MKKTISKAILRSIIAPLARLVYRKYRPLVVAITGSVGKSTTLETIHQVLAPYFDTETSHGAGNTEWGIAAAMLAPGYHAYAYDDAGWAVMRPHHLLWVFLVGLTRFFLPLKYPRVLVLELGIDHPGDMDFFNSLMRYDVAILTRVGNAHVGYFKDRAELFDEKIKIFAGLKSTGLALYGADQQELVAVGDKLVVRHVGVADKGVGEVKSVVSKIENGANYVTYQANGKTINLILPLGHQWISACGFAIAVANEFALEPNQIESALAGLRTIKGRFQVHELQRGIILVDDAYNASPDSMKMALTSLKSFVKANQYVAVLGDMKELGGETASSHLEIGNWYANKVEHLFTVGEAAGDIAKGALNAGMEESEITSWPALKTDAEVSSAVDAILAKIGDNDAILVKASKSMGFDRVVKEIISKLKKV